MYRRNTLFLLLAGLLAFFVACAGPSEESEAPALAEAGTSASEREGAETPEEPAEGAEMGEEAGPQGPVAAEGIDAEAAGPSAPDELTDVTNARPDTLLAMLPEDTILYLSIEDVQSMCEGLKGSALGRIYHDAETQDFLAGGLEMLDQGWVQLRGMAAGMGVPEKLTHWEALRSVEAGFAMRPQEGLENPFDAPPQMYLAVRAGLEEGLAQQAFDFITPMAEQQGFEFIASDDGGVLASRAGGMGGGPPMELSVHGDALLFELKMGARGKGSLATTASYMHARERVSGKGTAVFAYMRFAELWETMKLGLAKEEPSIAGMMQSMLDPILMPLESVSMASGWDGGTSFTNLAICLNENPGELWRTGNADMALLDYVPADSTSFSVTDLTAADAWMRHLLSSLDALAEMEVQPGMTMEQMAMEQGGDMHAWLFGEKRVELDQALASIGTRGFSYGRSTGMSSEDISYTEVDDPAALSHALEQLLPRLREALMMADADVQLQAKRVKRRVQDENGDYQTVAGPAYYSLDFSAFIPPELASFGLAVEPTMAVTEDGWMAFSMARGPVRTALTKGVEKPDKNIRENADVQAFLGRLPADAASITWNDPRPMLEGLLGLALGFAPMASDAVAQTGLPFDLNNLPPVNVFIDPLMPTETVSSMQGGDMVITARGSFGLADLIGTLGAGASLAPVAMMVSPMMVDETRPTESAEAIEEF